MRSRSGEKVPRLGAPPKRKRKKQRSSAIEANKRISSGPSLERRESTEFHGGLRECCIQESARCSLQVAPVCSMNNERYHHLTLGEHMCHSCYEEFWKSDRSLHESFRKWKTTWTSSSRIDPTYRIFVAEELCPVWMRCQTCSKWRCLSRETKLSPDVISSFLCTSVENNYGACKDVENTGVKEVGSQDWFKKLAVPVLLRSSPAVSFLNNEYFNEEIGMSPTEDFKTVKWLRKDQPYSEVLQPFYVPTESGKALCVRPDVMEYDEIIEFSEYATEPRMYLGLRNLVIALWTLNPLEWVTYEKCEAHIICRGMVRILCVKEVKRVVWFLTVKGIVNFGLLPMPCPLSILNIKKDVRVGVIGAGMSGLTAAHQLHNFGCNVTVLEAQGRSGGRMCDDFSLGVAVGKGAQLVTGVVNNPIIVMSLQNGTSYAQVGDECPLLDASTGELVDPLIDMRVDFHFNCLLDGLAEWKKCDGVKETSVQEQFLKIHEMFLSKSKMKWSKAEERLFQFQLGNLEFSCGANLSDVSALQWDQNEQFAQFAGDHALLDEGGSKLTDKLAANLDIRLEHQVTRVDYSKKDVQVTCKNGEKMTFDKVLITVPLFVLQLGNFRFNPPLPKEKNQAIYRMGAGIIEKVAVKFSRNFWAQKTKGANYFGHIPSTAGARGLFNMFYDFTNKKSKQDSFVLMSYVCGEAVDIVNTKTDTEVVDIFMETLQQLFPEEEIPPPEGHVITHWGRDPSFGMSYSYVRKGAAGTDYAAIAKDVDEKLYFAGEATNQYFPQTMTGAYLSGVREAAKILMSIR